MALSRSTRRQSDLRSDSRSRRQLQRRVARDRGLRRRPHFALTAEHLFDLGGTVGASGEDLFSWRTDYSPRFDADNQELAGADLSARIDEEFSTYVERTATDYDQHTRAPWTRGPDD